MHWNCRLLSRWYQLLWQWDLCEQMWENRENIWDRRKVFCFSRFAGISIRRTFYGYIVEQSNYVFTLRELTRDSIFDDCRTIWHKLAWISIMRPDISSNTNIASQVTEDLFHKKHILAMNKSIRKLISAKRRRIQYYLLDLDTLRLIAISDASLVSIIHLPSQLAHIVLLTDGKYRVSVLSYSSYKVKRVIRSALSAETYSFYQSLWCSV